MSRPDSAFHYLHRWNMLQASWGTGKAFYSNSFPALDLDENNPFSRFKTIGYSALPSAKPSDGIISSIIKKKSSELEAQKDQIAAGILQGVWIVHFVELLKAQKVYFFQYWAIGLMSKLWLIQSRELALTHQTSPSTSRKQILRLAKLGNFLLQRYIHSYPNRCR